MFKTNVGPLDRFFRVVVGLALLSLLFVGPRTMWGLIGLIPLTTALLGTCPLYTLLGLSSCPARR